MFNAKLTVFSLPGLDLGLTSLLDKIIQVFFSSRREVERARRVDGSATYASKIVGPPLGNIPGDIGTKAFKRAFWSSRKDRNGVQEVVGQAVSKATEGEACVDGDGVDHRDLGHGF